MNSEALTHFWKEVEKSSNIKKELLVPLIIFLGYDTSNLCEFSSSVKGNFPDFYVNNDEGEKIFAVKIADRSIEKLGFPDLIKFDTDVLVLISCEHLMLAIKKNKDISKSCSTHLFSLDELTDSNLESIEILRKGKVKIDGIGKMLYLDMLEKNVTERLVAEVDMDSNAFLECFSFYKSDHVKMSEKERLELLLSSVKKSILGLEELVRGVSNSENKEHL